MSGYGGYSSKSYKEATANETLPEIIMRGRESKIFSEENFKGRSVKKTGK